MLLFIRIYLSCTGVHTVVLTQCSEHVGFIQGHDSHVHVNVRVLSLISIHNVSYSLSLRILLYVIATVNFDLDLGFF